MLASVCPLEMTSQPIASSSKLTPATSSTPLTDYIEPEAPLFIAKSTVIAGPSLFSHRILPSADRP